jgi:Tol biopolymer transport system component
MEFLRSSRGCALLLIGLAGVAGAQAVELTRSLARGNLYRGTTALTRDGRWVVFAGRYSSSSPGYNSLYGVASDGSSEPFLLYDHGDIPGVAREFDPGTVTFVHLTSNSRWAVFTVDERGLIYSARLPDEARTLPYPTNPDPFLRLAAADTGRDFQIAPDGSRAVFFGYDGALYSVPIDGHGSAVEIVPESDGQRVRTFAIDPSSTRVVYTVTDVADEESSVARSLYSVPIDGSAAPSRLTPRPPRAYTGTPPAGAPSDFPASEVTDFQLAPDGGTVLFLVQETRGSVVTHLYVAPTDGSAVAQRLASGDVRLAAFAPDSQRVVYRLTPAAGGATALIAHPLDGSAPLRLHEPADAVARLTVLDDAVLFLESPSGAGGDGLLRVPLDGSHRAREVSAALPAGRAIRDFHASPDGEHVVYSADADTAGVFTLFTGPLVVEHARRIGSRPPEGVRGIGRSADVARFVFPPDSAAVLAHVASPEGLRLERVGLDGSVRRLSGPEGASDLALDDAGAVAMYRGAREHETDIHVYSVRVDEGAPPLQLDDFGPELGSLLSFEIHPNGREAIFAAGSRDFSFYELHRVPLDLSGPPRVLPGLVVGDESLVDHRVEPTTDRIVYRLQSPELLHYVLQLYSAPLDLSAPRVRLDQGEASVFDYQLAGGRVLFRQSTGTLSNEHFEIFSVPVDGSSAPQVLNGVLPANGRVYAYALSPDRARVVYLAAQNTPNRAELFSVPIDGSQAPVQLNPPPVTGGEVWRGPIRITPDGANVVFAGDLTLNNAFSLWAAPLAGGAPARTLWTATTAGREVERLELTPDSTRAVFTADGIQTSRHQLFVVPVDGSAAAAPLPATSGAPKVYEFRLTPDGTRAVYSTSNLVAIVRVDGSAAATSLSPLLPADRHVVGLPLATDEWVLYQADQDVPHRFDLYAVPADGSLPSRRVNVPQGDNAVQSYAIAGDEVVFVAPSTPDYGSWQLFRAPLAGGGSPRALNLPGTFAGTFLLHPDEHRVLFSGTSGNPPGARLYLGFLGRPIRGAERP